MDDTENAPDAGPKPASPLFATLSVLCTFGSAAFPLGVLAVSEICGALGIIWRYDNLLWLSVLLVPCMCVPGVIVGQMGYRRYRERKQTAGVVVAGLSIRFGLAAIPLALFLYILFRKG